jgi:flagellar basal-body rod modification protein FlgD
MQLPAVNAFRESQATGPSAANTSGAPNFQQVLEQLANPSGHSQPVREVKKSLGKDDFLRLMIEQMKNQDPSSPFKPEQMATEMAQFTSVEQLTNLNQTLTRHLAQEKPHEKLAFSQLIGKKVTLDGLRLSHQEGNPEQVSFVLPEACENVQITIKDMNDQVVHSRALVGQKKGVVQFQWDGLNTFQTPTQSGSLRIEVSAVNGFGQKVAVDSVRQGIISGVAFEHGKPVLLMQDQQSVKQIALEHVIRIEEGSFGGGGVRG